MTNGHEKVRVIMGRAEDELASARRRPPAIAPAQGEASGGPGSWTPGPDGMPPDCPVTVLGVNDGILYVIDAHGQLYPITARGGFTDSVVQYVFGGRNDYLAHYWPNKKGSDFDMRAVRGTMMAAGARRGIWNAVESVRGLGAWRGADGELIWHTGSAVYFGHRAAPPGEYDGIFYPARPAISRPWPRPVGMDENPAPKILRALASWHWERPDVAPFLVLGHIGAMMLSGALDWRPSVFLTGDAAVGKTTLQDLIQACIGPDYLVRTAETTAAGLYQRLGMDARPVAVDEFEPTEDNFKRVQAIMSLMRIAASGDLMLRGGADHGGVEFRARSAFLFSAINSPAVNKADISRLCVLNLRRLDERAQDADPPDFGVMDDIPAMLMRRLSDSWERWDELSTEYRKALAAGGHDSRGQDTYGTLLTCAHMLLGDDGVDDAGFEVEDMRAWSERMATWRMPEIAEAEANWVSCLKHLLTAQIDAWRGGAQVTIGAVLERMRKPNTMEDTFTLADAAHLLQAAGVTVIDRAELGPVLAIPNRGSMVARIFDGTRWGGHGDRGVWATALRQGPRDVIITDKALNRARINGQRERCTMVRLDAWEKLWENAEDHDEANGNLPSS